MLWLLCKRSELHKVELEANMSILLILTFVTMALAFGQHVPDCPPKGTVWDDLPPVFPVRPDPYVEFDDDFLSGYLEMTYAKWEGLHTIESTLDPDCTSDYPHVEVTFQVDAEFFELSGTLDLQLKVFLNSSFAIPIQASGSTLRFRLDQPHVLAVARALHDNETDGLGDIGGEIDFKFEGVSLNVEDFRIGGKVVDWEPINQWLKPGFDLYWPALKPLADILMEVGLAQVFKDCTLTNIIESDLECINMATWPATTQLQAAFRELMKPTSGLGKWFEEQEVCDHSAATTTTTTARTNTTTTMTTTTTAKNGATRQELHVHMALLLILLVNITNYYN